MASANSKRKVIAMDTNFLTAILQFRVDVFSEIKSEFGSNIKFVVPAQVNSELERISEKGGKIAMAVKIAKEAMRKNKVGEVEVSARNADSALAKIAQDGAVVATNDRNLKKRIKALGGTVIYLRQKKFIEVNG